MVFDPLAQLVEHNTFNVGVMGSSPMRITKAANLAAFFMPKSLENDLKAQ